jgi:hypothetical protein
MEVKPNEDELCIAQTVGPHEAAGSGFAFDVLRFRGAFGSTYPCPYSQIR